MPTARTGAATCNCTRNCSLHWSTRAGKPDKPDRTSGPPPALLRPSRSPKSPRPEYASEPPCHGGWVAATPLCLRWHGGSRSGGERPPPAVGKWDRRERQGGDASCLGETCVPPTRAVTLARRGLLECEKNVMAATFETSVCRSRSGCAYLFSIEGENGCQMKLAAMALAITVALSNTAALARPGDQVPTFDINRNCSSEAAAGVDIQATMAGCVRDEVDAKKQLEHGPS